MRRIKVEVVHVQSPKAMAFGQQYDLRSLWGIDGGEFWQWSAMNWADGNDVLDPNCYDCGSAAFTGGASALTGGLGAWAGKGLKPAKGLKSPFLRKNPEQLDRMFRAKSFDPREPNHLNGKGGYVNPSTGRSFHIDEANSFGEPPHVDVNRPKI